MFMYNFVSAGNGLTSASCKAHTVLSLRSSGQGCTAAVYLGGHEL